MSISSISFRAQGKTEIKAAKTPEKQQADNKTTAMKALPYAAGVVILAASAYAFRGKIAKIFKKAPEMKTPKIKPEPTPVETKPISSTPNLPVVIERNSADQAQTFKPIELKPEIKAQIMGEQPFKFNLQAENKPAVKQEITPVTDPSRLLENKPQTQVLSQELNTVKKQESAVKPLEEISEVISEDSVIDNTPKFQNVCIGFDKEGKPMYEVIETSPNLPPVRSAFQEALESVDFNNQSVISKIEKIRNSESENIERILNENTHNGHVDIPMMKKVADDYMLDAERGEDRFHQAADLLEQAHIREFVKGDSKSKTGMYNLVDSVTTDPVLYKCYQNMPMEESANRLNYLKEHDLKSETYKEGMDAEGFFNKAFNRLVEKYQFKKYNEAHGIS